MQLHFVRGSFITVIIITLSLYTNIDFIAVWCACFIWVFWITFSLFWFCEKFRLKPICTYMWLCPIHKTYFQWQMMLWRLMVLNVSIILKLNWTDWMTLLLLLTRNSNKNKIQISSLNIDPRVVCHKNKINNKTDYDYYL